MKMINLKTFKKRELIVLFLILSFSIQNSEFIFNSTNNIQILKQDLNLSSFSYIFIDEDSDFVDYGFPGNGTKTDPYLIQDLTLSENSTTLSSIHIENTTRFFLISKNTITANNNYSIYLNNIAGGTGVISDNIFDFSDTSWPYSNIGISIVSSNGIKIEKNDFKFCFRSIELWWSEDIDIYNNEIRHHDLIGVGSHNINIENNNLLGSVRFTSGSSYITIKNNYIHAHTGVYFSETTYSEISSNYFEYPYDEAISLTESSNNIIHNNIIEDAGVGIEIKSNSNQITLTENTCAISRYYNLFVESCENIICSRNNFSLSTYHNVIFHDVSKIVFINNDVVSAGYHGLYFSTCPNVFIGQNYIARSDQTGIYCDNVDDSTIIDNYIHQNSDYGLFFDIQSSNNVIHHNEFYNNNLDGYSQACDNGENNTWFNPTLKEGNLWMDYEGKGDYYIDGTAQSVDIYPLNSEPTKTNNLSFSTGIIFSAITILAVYFLGSKRKMRYSKSSKRRL
ncbi:MAG: NosD domain-containing protein [Candidatus Heimdallarchaeaceae archaeon]